MTVYMYEERFVSMPVLWLNNLRLSLSKRHFFIMGSNPVNTWYVTFNKLDQTRTSINLIILFVLMQILQMS